MGRAAAGFYLFEDGVGRNIARGQIAPLLAHAIARGELLALAVEEPPAELIAERVPHDGIHANEPRRQMTDRKELHEFHVDEGYAGAQRQRVAVAAHVGGGAVAAITPGEPAGRKNGRLGRNGDRGSACEMERARARDFAVVADEIDDQEIAG